MAKETVSFIAHYGQEGGYIRFAGERSEELFVCENLVESRREILVLYSILSHY